MQGEAMRLCVGAEIQWKERGWGRAARELPKTREGGGSGEIAKRRRSSVLVRYIAGHTARELFHYMHIWRSQHIWPKWERGEERDHSGRRGISICSILNVVVGRNRKENISPFTPYGPLATTEKSWDYVILRTYMYVQYRHKCTKGITLCKE